MASTNVQGTAHTPVDAIFLSPYAQPRAEGRVMGPFQTPWLTFAAWIVIGGSILMVLVWSYLSFRRRDDR